MSIEHWGDASKEVMHTRISGPGADDLIFSTAYMDIVLMTAQQLREYVHRRALIVAAARYGDSGD